MKAYSSHGIYDAKLARVRRKERNPSFCSAYLKTDGTWQLDRDPMVCREYAIAEGTCYREFLGNLEDYLDGKHYLVVYP